MTKHENHKRMTEDNSDVILYRLNELTAKVDVINSKLEDKFVTRENLDLSIRPIKDKVTFIEKILYAVIAAVVLPLIAKVLALIIK